MTREFRSHAFHSLLEGMHSAAVIGRQALQALDVIHVAFAEDRGSWRGTDHYADKLDEGVRRLAFEVRLRRGDEAEDRVPCATKREVKVHSTPVFAAGTLLAVVGHIDAANKRVELAGPDFKGKPSWQEVQVACKEVIVINHWGDEVTVNLEDLEFTPAAVLKARPKPRLDNFDD